MTRIAREAGRHRLADDAAPLLEYYADLYAATAGRISPLVGERLSALGYGADYRLESADTLPRVPTWAEAMAWDGVHLDTVSSTLLDVGAAGKGYLVDIVSRLLAELGRPTHIVDASGDLTTHGVPMRIALENPANPSRAIGVAELTEGALCASATNRRAWGDRLHHVLDAVTGAPVRSVIATWAVAASALVADGAATALFFDVDPEFLSRHEVEFVRLFGDGRVERSAGFDGEVFA